MTEIKAEAVRYAISQIKDGWVFEEFAKSFLTARFSHEFTPVGGSKDKGIDGLQHTFSRKGMVKQIYQISTELDIVGKIKRTIETLQENNISFDNITYVSSRKINDKDNIINKLYDEYSIAFTIYDQDWFVLNVTSNQGTRNAYFTFIESYLHEFSQPGKSYTIHKVDTDSRLYVFLRQQLDSKWNNSKLDDLLADTLILFSLEETDPDKNIFKTKEQIFESIREYVKFDPKILSETIIRRLKVLSEKPRKIRYHKADKKYCLPYETRLEITQRNLLDKQLQTSFCEQTEQVIKGFLKENDANVKDVTELINLIIHRIYYQQGLEFSNFILCGESQESIEKDLQDTIGLTVDESSVVLKNKELVKTALLMSIRHIVYNGTEEQKKYLKCLSNTYMMMFLLQWNPQIALYFESMASKLCIYVCTSILIPAFSEYYLDEQNKRHWNLLKNAQYAGIKLFINDAIVDELVHHFKMIKAKYESLFKAEELVYLDNQLQMLYIDEILIRAYFHAKSRGHVLSFYDYLNNFCDPNLYNPKNELIDYLRHEFAIIYQPDEQKNISINKEEHRKLSDELSASKRNPLKSDTDASIILTIYKIREKNNETSNAGIFGYRTWWLSKDTTTYYAVQKVLKNRYPVSCYIRPDFLYNHITLAPKMVEVDSLYKQIFPTLLGVNLSFHLPKEVTQFIQEKIREHSTKHPARMKSILRNLTEKLQSDPNARNRNYVKSFFEEQLQNEIMSQNV